MTSSFSIGYVIRLVRSVRTLRAIKRVRGILFALLASIPALFNIAMLLFIICFVYSLIGMAFFAHVKLNGALSETENFQTFSRSMLLLFRLVPMSGWDAVLKSLSISPPNCDPHLYGPSLGDCGDPGLGTLFICSYLILTRMILVNMYVAVILQNYELAQADAMDLITFEDLDRFYKIWGLFDPCGTQFISVRDLEELLDQLPPPFQIQKPNSITIASLDIPIGYPNQVHCLDVILALLQHMLRYEGEPEEIRVMCQNIRERFIQSYPKLANKIIVTTTGQQRKSDMAAKRIQRAFKKYKFLTGIGNNGTAKFDSDSKMLF